MPIIGRRIEQETTIDGLTMPQGSTASVFVHMIHRNPDIWKNPNEFDPERFLDQGYDPLTVPLANLTKG